jgi:adenine-specific DNA-methyltransferase
MLNYIIDKTDVFISSKTKVKRKSFGQFFTSKETARFMAELFSAPAKDTVKILDPGAGSGILSAAAVEIIEKQHGQVKNIELTCYENNADVWPLLEANLEYMKRSSKLKLTATIIKDDYLLSQADDFSMSLFASACPQKYDWVIGNPPYLMAM